MARLYADENFPSQAVVAPRRLGHDVLTTMEAGQAGRGIPDDLVLAFAGDDGRVVLAHNRKDFRDLHNGGFRHAGLVLCTVDPDASALANRIDAALAGAGDPAGRLIRVNRATGR